MRVLSCSCGTVHLRISVDSDFPLPFVCLDRKCVGYNLKKRYICSCCFHDLCPLYKLYYLVKAIQLIHRNVFLSFILTYLFVLLMFYFVLKKISLLCRLSAFGRRKPGIIALSLLFPTITFVPYEQGTKWAWWMGRSWNARFLPCLFRLSIAAVKAEFPHLTPCTSCGQYWVSWGMR